MKRKRVSLQWWKCDLVNFVASHLDAEALVNFSLCCKDVNVNLKSTQTYVRFQLDFHTAPISLINQKFIIHSCIHPSYPYFYSLTHSNAHSQSTTQRNARTQRRLRWLADLRGIPHSLDNFEQLELAEAMANFKSMIFFNWSDTNLANPDHVSLGVVARALHRHSSLSLSIEAHCSLEGMLHLPTRGTNNTHSL